MMHYHTLGYSLCRFPDNEILLFVKLAIRKHNQIGIVSYLVSIVLNAARSTHVQYTRPDTSRKCHQSSGEMHLIKDT